MTKTLEQQSRLYYVWCGMRCRCNYKKSNRYKSYGGKGIKVCKEWDNYWNFKKWALENGYDINAKRGEYTLDRIDVNGDYEPNNCRFITNKEQSRNKSTNVFLEYKGERHTLIEWAEITGIKVGTIQQRFHKHWTPEKILTLKPIIGRNQYSK